MSGFSEASSRGKAVPLDPTARKRTDGSPDVSRSPDTLKRRDVTPKHNTSLGFWENFMLSGAAAVVSKTAAAPLERVKLLMQNQDMIIRQGLLHRPYRGVTDCIVTTFKHEGVLPFWRGNLANCIRYFPTQALNFAFKDKIKIVFNLRHTDGTLSKLTKNVASGGVAGTLSLTFVYSLDFARTRLANDVKGSADTTQRQYSGLVDVYRKSLRTDGVAGLYRGFAISCVGIFVYRGCYFGFYDTLKPMLLGENAGFVVSFILGYAITVASETIAYPIDTVRRRMMMTTGEKVKYKGSIDCLTQIVRNEGVMSLMKGTTANILRGVAGAGVLVGFDKFKELYLGWRLTY